jgi:hypothetical protein
VVLVLVIGTGGVTGLVMRRTWLPVPNPWGGTTNRVLLRRICVPAARGVVVLMTILCCTVLAAVVVDGIVLVEKGLVLPVILACFNAEAGV